MKNLSRRTVCIVLPLILAIGLLLRVAVITRYAQGPNTYSDDNGYLTGGITFSNTGYVAYADVDKQTTATCVGMPFTVGALIALFGYTPHGLIAAHIAFSCFGLLTAVAAYLLGTLLHSRLAGVLAAFLCIFEPGLVSTNCVFLTESPYLCLNLFSLYFYLRCSQSWSLKYFWFGVLCMIAAALFKGLALLSCIIIIPVLWRRRVPIKKWIGKVAVGVLAFAICFAPWWVRNELLLNRFVAFTANRGDIQLMGSYMGVGYPEGTYEDMVLQLDAEAWEQGYQEDTERRFERRGEVGKERLAQWFRENPVAFLFSHFIYKPFTMTTLHMQGIRVVPPTLGRAAWWGCLILALWGLLHVRKKGKNDVYAPALYLWVGVLVTAVYAPLARYGLPYVPIWLLYASFGLCDLLSRFCQKTDQRISSVH